MRRTVSLFNEKHQYGWYDRFMKLGPKGFKKYEPPTPFDWIKPSPFVHSTNLYLNQPIPIRPRAYFEINIGNDVAGKITFELAEDIVPKTVENFRRLCCGEGVKSMNNGSYQGTKFHFIRKKESAVGGDIESKTGKFSHSSYEERFFEDENFIIPHSERGLISMASRGIHTNGSQFYIDLAPNSHLNGRCVVFGRVIEGDDVLKEMESVFTIRSVPSRDITIVNCGYMDSATVNAINNNNSSSGSKGNSNDTTKSLKSSKQAAVSS